MKTKLITGVVIAALSLGTMAGSAGAMKGEHGKATPQNTDCQRAGMGTLKSLDLLPAVAKGGIEVVGVGVVDFPTVLKLHREQPELFRTGGVSVVVPGVGEVPATWCDGV